MRNGQIAITGDLGLKVIRGNFTPSKETAETIWERIRRGLPFGVEDKELRVWKYRNLPNLYRGLRTVLLSRALHLPSFWGELELVKIFGNGRLLDYGLVSFRVVTDTGVGYIVDAFANSVELENMKYHGLGTGSSAEGAGETALVTELTTEYTGNVRATGTTEEGASANIYKTVATNTLDSGTPVLREHGVLSQAATGGGVLLDRSLYAAINLDGTAGDGLQSTYQLTFTAGS